MTGEGFTGTLREGKEVLVKVQSEDASWVANRLGNIGITGTYLLLCFVRYRTITRADTRPNTIQCAPTYPPLAGSRVEELLNSEGKMRRVVLPTHSLQQVAQHIGR